MWAYNVSLAKFRFEYYSSYEDTKYHLLGFAFLRQPTKKGWPQRQFDLYRLIDITIGMFLIFYTVLVEILDKITSR